MPAGAGTDFFEVHNNPQVKLLETINLVPGKYFIYFGRFSEAKNVPGVVKVFGEAHRLAPEYLEGFKLVLVGGSPENPQPEEIAVESQIRAAMEEYRFHRRDIIRLSSQPWSMLAVLAHHCAFYIGMQVMEPFGMGVAEAMAAGAPVMISEAAGITPWIEDGTEALIANPHDPHRTAERILEIMRDEVRLEKLSERGRKLSFSTFNWQAIGRKQGEIIDLLCQGKSPDGETATTVMQNGH